MNITDIITESADSYAVFEIDSEDAFNQVMDRFGHVIEWSGNLMVVLRKYWPAIEQLAFSAGGQATEVGDEQLNELTFMGSQCTKDCSGHRAGYNWSVGRGRKSAASWSNSFNKGAELAATGH